MLKYSGLRGFCRFRELWGALLWFEMGVFRGGVLGFGGELYFRRGRLK